MHTGVGSGAARAKTAEGASNPRPRRWGGAGVGRRAGPWRGHPLLGAAAGPFIHRGPTRAGPGRAARRNNTTRRRRRSFCLSVCLSAPRPSPRGPTATGIGRRAASRFAIRRAWRGGPGGVSQRKHSSRQQYFGATASDPATARHGTASHRERGRERWRDSSVAAGGWLVVLLGPSPARRAKAMTSRSATVTQWHAERGGAGRIASAAALHCCGVACGVLAVCYQQATSRRGRQVGLPAYPRWPYGPAGTGRGSARGTPPSACVSLKLHRAARISGPALMPIRSDLDDTGRVRHVPHTATLLHGAQPISARHCSRATTELK